MPKYDTDKKIDILDLTRDQLVDWLAERDIAPYRADQIQKWIYLRQVDRFELMTDISKEIRGLLARHFVVGRLGVEQIEKSRDGSRKYLFRLNDGRHIFPKGTMIRSASRARWAALRGAYSA